MLQGIQNNNLLLVSNFPTTGVRIHWPTVIMFSQLIFIFLIVQYGSVPSAMVAAK